MSQKLSQLNESLSDLVGSLVYIPSEATLSQFGEPGGKWDRPTITAQVKLLEPAIVPIVRCMVEDPHHNNTVEVYYEGQTWWAKTRDLYKLEDKEV